MLDAQGGAAGGHDLDVGVVHQELELVVPVADVPDFVEEQVGGLSLVGQGVEGGGSDDVRSIQAVMRRMGSSMSAVTVTSSRGTRVMW